MAQLSSRLGAEAEASVQAANLELKGAAAGEQEMKSECNSLRLALDAARLAVAGKDAECVRLQQSLHASRAELVELAAKHRCLPQQASCLASPHHAIRGIAEECAAEMRCLRHSSALLSRILGNPAQSSRSFLPSAGAAGSNAL